MNRVRLISLIIAWTTLCNLNVNNLFADEIFLKNGDSLKGIVVEQYDDRIIVSTSGGEIGIYKNRILNTEFNNVEQSYLWLGDTYLKKNELDRAEKAYKDALEINPDFQSAKDALLRLQETKKADVIEAPEIKEQMDFILRNMFGIEIDKISNDNRLQVYLEFILRNMLGIEIDRISNDNRLQVYPNCPAVKDQIQTGNKLVAVHGLLIKYMPIVNVEKYLIGSGKGKVRITIERDVQLYKPGKLGVEIEIKQTGLTVTHVVTNSAAERMKLQKGDRIVKINEKSTRYMNIKQAVKNLKQGCEQQLSLVMRRDIVLDRRPFEGKEIVASLEKKQGDYLGLKLADNNVEIISIVENSPADKAGLKNGDKILEVAGKSTKYTTYKRLIDSCPTEEELELTVEQNVPMAMTKIPGTNRKGLGIKIETVSDGIIITDVTKNSAADLAKLKAGDIITAIDKEGIRNMAMSGIIKKLKERQNVKFSIAVRRKIKVRRKVELTQ
ncbi:PDZ domain-containing protein [bacterium]|nr:PDZ domain-containing protein [bacterium]